jgi:hypothetical protein
MPASDSHLSDQIAEEKDKIKRMLHRLTRSLKHRVELTNDDNEIRYEHDRRYEHKHGHNPCYKGDHGRNPCYKGDHEHNPCYKGDHEHNPCHKGEHGQCNKKRRKARHKFDAIESRINALRCRRDMELKNKRPISYDPVERDMVTKADGHCIIRRNIGSYFENNGGNINDNGLL